MGIDKQALGRIVPDKTRLLFGSSIPQEYLSDALGRLKGKAEALVFPLSADDVSGILRYANANHIPVTPRGAGTNLVGSTVPLHGGIILDLSRMNRILELDRDTMTITVEPGILLQDLQAYGGVGGLLLSAGPRRKSLQYRRQHQHQRRVGCGR